MKNTKEEIKELALPLEKSEAKTDLVDFTQLWYGREKIGKTSLLAQYPDLLIFSFEPGCKALSVYETHPKNWAEFKKYIRLLEKTKRFRTIGVDTVDLAYQMCYEYVCTKMGVVHPKDDAWTIWKMIRTEFAKEVIRLASIRPTVFLSHESEKELKVRSGEYTHRIIPSMSKQAREVLEPLIDIWAYMRYKDDGNREILIRGTKHISAGHRLPNNFIDISKIDMGKSAEEAYTNFISAFNNKADKKINSKLKLKMKVK